MLRAVRPYAREAVGLQLQIDGKLILFAGVLLRKTPHSAFNAQELLHVVAEFMSDDVGLREVSGVATEALEVAPESQVNIDLLVPGQ